MTVGGSGRRRGAAPPVIAAYPEAARRVNGLRMIAVAGPRIDPASLEAPPGVEVRGFVPDLYRHLAACDLAVVQGGLTTTMELAAAGGRSSTSRCATTSSRTATSGTASTATAPAGCMDYATSTPDAIAAAIAEEIDRPVTSRPVEIDGAARAAALIAELL